MKLKTLTLTAGALALATLAPAQFQIAELGVNTQGSDVGYEYFEVRGAPNASLNDVWLLAIEGDGGAAGTVDGALNLSTFTLGSSGYFYGRNDLGPAAQTGVNEFVYDIPLGTSLTGGGFENGTISFLLVSGFTGAAGDDLDTDNDGVLDSTPYASVLDSIGWNDGGTDDRNYSSIAFLNGTTNAKLNPTSAFTPDGFMRLNGDGFLLGDYASTPAGVGQSDFDVDDDTDASRVAYYSQYRGAHTDGTSRDFDFQDWANSGYASAGDANRLTTFRITPGAVNPVPEPATMAALGLGLVGLASRRRKKSA